MMVIFIGLTPVKNAVAQTGAVDTNFNIGTGLAGSFVHALAVNADGQILAGGNFTRVQGSQRNHVAQFNADGSLDLGFSPAPGAHGEVLAVAYQPDRKVLIGGGFTRVNNTNRNHVARFNIDGTLDSSFDPGSGANNNVRGLAVQPDSKVLIVGEFTRYNGITNNCVARLNPDGTLDQSFRAGVGVGGNRFVEEVRLLADGKILIAGDFSSYNGTPRASIARLNPDGSLDAAFDPGAGAKPLARLSLLDHVFVFFEGVRLRVS